MKTKSWSIFLLLALILVATSYAQDVTLNYEGRVRVHGSPLTGTGYFKLAIVNNPGTISFWSNDETSSAGDEPVAAIVADVTDGFFNITVGDTSIVNMAVIDPTVFNLVDRVRLRVWFSEDGVEFERLRPDRLITNPGLLGIQSTEATNIYVDPELGDDANSGLKSEAPKETIQAAWDMIPSIVKNEITIQLAQGVYKQTATLRGKTVVGDQFIKLRGNKIGPMTVLLTGSDVESGSPTVRLHGIIIQDQDNVRIEGVAFTRFGRGAYINESTGIMFMNCIFSENLIGIKAKSSQVYIADSEFADGAAAYPLAQGTTYGITFENLTRADVLRTTFARQNTGILVSRNSYLQLQDGCIFEDHERAGVISNMLSTANFTMTGANHLFKDNPTGIRADLNAILLYPESHCTFDGNTNDFVVINGSQSWGP